MTRGLTRPFLAGLLGLWLVVPVGSRAGDANLDPTFGTFGIVTTTIGDASDVAVAGARQGDGKIVVAGISHEFATAGDAILARYLPNGALDPSFGVGGIVITDVGGDYEQFVAVAIQPDGNVVAAGAVFGLTEAKFLVARYLPDGTPDPAFGVGGIVTTSIGGTRAQATAVALQPDGKIVASGSAVIGGTYRFAVARYEDDGDLDASFGTGGVVVTDVGGEGAATGLVRQPDGSLVVAGTRYTDNTFTDGDIVLAGYTEAGSADGAFGTGGITVTDLGPGIANAENLIRQTDGKLVLVGARYDGDYNTHAAVAVLRYTSNGNPDGTFGAGGVVITDLATGHDSAHGITQLADGRLVVVGQSGPLPVLNGGLDWLVLRYDATGTLDPTFGTGGHLTLGIGSSNDFANDVLAQPDGKIVVVGGGQLVGSASGAFALARFGGACGDGAAGPSEECDDGNATDGDCCSRGCQAQPVGSACTGNGSLCKVSQCNADAQCGRPIPATGCKLPTIPLKSQLQFRDKTPDKGDLAAWKWLKGDATALAAFGSPLTTTSYALCVYGDTPESLLFETNAPAGGTCHGRPCWRAVSTKGFKYADRDATPDGNMMTLLKAGDAGKASATVKGKGGNLALPPLPLPLPVRAQLRASTGACWEADFSAAGVKVNDATQFKGKSD